MEREKFSSRLGFILISAGCAIGLGNVWRFPYIVGKYGGAAFVLIYLAFLLVLGLPIVVMEFAVGRASKKSAALSFDLLEPKGSKWHLTKYIAMAGNYMLMMFYTTVAGWMLLYFFKMLRGDFNGLDSAGTAEEFSKMLADPVIMTVFMVVIVLVCFTICAQGLVSGVERITKIMMLLLFLLMVVLAVHSVLLEGGAPGLEFYLKPDFGSNLCSYGPVLLYLKYRNRRSCDFRKLYRQGKETYRRGHQHYSVRYLSCFYVRSYHFPGLLCLWD